MRRSSIFSSRQQGQMSVIDRGDPACPQHRVKYRHCHAYPVTIYQGNRQSKHQAEVQVCEACPLPIASRYCFWSILKCNRTCGTAIEVIE